VDVKTALDGNVAVLRAAGKLVIGDAESLLYETAARLVAEGQTRLLIDLSEVSMVDSSGIDALVRIWRLADERGGVMKLLNLTPRTRKLLDLTGLSSVWEIHGDQAQAVASFNSGGRPLTASSR
jgi:anti-sigma B factor antagonist